MKSLELEIELELVETDAIAVTGIGEELEDVDVAVVDVVSSRNTLPVKEGAITGGGT